MLFPADLLASSEKTKPEKQPQQIYSKPRQQVVNSKTAQASMHPEHGDTVTQNKPAKKLKTKSLV